MRRFEFSEGGSQKFWEIDVRGSDFTVRYGKIGTEGQSKTTACGSADQAIAESAKLIREKTRKGYQEIGAVQRNWRPPVAYGTGEHPDHFMNYAVARFNPDADGEAGEDDGEFKTYATLRDPERRAYAIHASYDDEGSPLERFTALLADPKAPLLKALILGNWFGEVCDDPPTDFIARIVAQPERLGGLAGLFAGDVVQEEAEISWLNQCDWAPALHALPQLEEFVVRGGNGLRLSGLAHAKLRSLTIQSGGLSAELVRDVAQAKLPALKNLTLWLGCESYGGAYAVEDLAPLLAGDGFPQLEYLGLMNAELADDVAVAVAKAPILGRLKGLDLSMGTLSDRGALALLQSPALRKLTWLSLRHHYLSEAVIRQFKALGIEVDVSDRETGDEDDRYCEVTE